MDDRASLRGQARARTSRSRRRKCESVARNDDDDDDDEAISTHGTNYVIPAGPRRRDLFAILFAVRPLPAPIARRPYVAFLGKLADRVVLARTSVSVASRRAGRRLNRSIPYSCSAYVPKYVETCRVSSSLGLVVTGSTNVVQTRTPPRVLQVPVCGEGFVVHTSLAADNGR